MAIGGGFVLESEWYWRIYEGDARFEDEPGKTAARDFLWPLSGLARERFALDDIAVDPDGDSVRFRIGDLPVAIRCRGLRIDQFVAAINDQLAAAELDLKFAIIESRRYELRGVLIPRDEAVRCRVARGTPPPMLRSPTPRDD
ncbi:MAG TPA: hypothetical protein VK601_07740 [Kofleriaceae bacterium]|nr:hypothetical protein [Kofleriaceae bacterium]